MTEITEFQQRSAAVALTKMFRETYFSVSTLDAIAVVLGRKAHCAGPDYEALRALHCVNWADMGPDLTRMAKEACLQVLGLPSSVVDAVATERETPRTSERIRLAFWRR